jgi:hypothetical protein
MYSSKTLSFLSYIAPLPAQQLPRGLSSLSCLESHPLEKTEQQDSALAGGPSCSTLAREAKNPCARPSLCLFQMDFLWGLGAFHGTHASFRPLPSSLPSLDSEICEDPFLS